MVNVGMYWNSICATSGAPVPACRAVRSWVYCGLALTDVHDLDLDGRVLLLEEGHFLLDVRDPRPEGQRRWASAIAASMSAWLTCSTAD